MEHRFVTNTNDRASTVTTTTLLSPTLTVSADKIAEKKQFARLMRGHVPEWEDDYIEKIVPGHVLKVLDEQPFTDKEGYVWSYTCMSACKIKSTDQNVVVVASKYCGQGYYEMKVVSSLTSPVVKICGDDLR